MPPLPLFPGAAFSDATARGTGPRSQRPEDAMLDRGFFRWVCIVAALLFAVVWLLSAAGYGFAAPAWVGPAGLLALAIVVALP